MRAGRERVGSLGLCANRHRNNPRCALRALQGAMLCVPVGTIAPMPYYPNPTCAQPLPGPSVGLGTVLAPTAGLKWAWGPVGSIRPKAHYTHSPPQAELGCPTNNPLRYLSPVERVKGAQGLIVRPSRSS